MREEEYSMRRSAEDAGVRLMPVIKMLLDRSDQPYRRGAARVAVGLRELRVRSAS